MIIKQNKPYIFSTLTRGNWRNALFIECKICPYGNTCDGYLLTADTEGAPVVFPVNTFCEETGERIEKNECAGILSREGFESLYNRWLLWNVSDKKQCSLLQITDI